MWLRVEEAIDLNFRGEIPIFYPQLLILSNFLFLNKTFNELKIAAKDGF